jgi:S-adenosylmethionine synthetase
MQQLKLKIICRLALDLAHKLLQELAALRRENKQIKYLRPDAKSQVTLEYDDNNRPVRIDAIVSLHSMMILIRKQKCRRRLKKISSTF